MKKDYHYLNILKKNCKGNFDPQEALKVVIKYNQTDAIEWILDYGNTDIDLGDDLSESGLPSSYLAKIDLILGNIACHRSIRSGRNLNEFEMNQLLREMEKTPNSGQCNHGRPTSISLSLKDIEKLFNRT